MDEPTIACMHDIWYSWITALRAWRSKLWYRKLYRPKSSRAFTVLTNTIGILRRPPMFLVKALGDISRVMQGSRQDLKVEVAHSIRANFSADRCSEFSPLGRNFHGFSPYPPRRKGRNRIWWHRFPFSQLELIPREVTKRWRNMELQQLIKVLYSVRLFPDKPDRIIWGAR